MDCAKCDAKCCNYSKFIVRLTDEEVESGKFDDAIAWQRYIPLPCVYLKNNKCSIYEHRPTVCREYTCKGDTRLLTNAGDIWCYDSEE